MIYLLGICKLNYQKNYENIFGWLVDEDEGL